MKMRPKEMVEKLKAMGLGRVQRALVMETFHDAGEKEALEQAEGYLVAHRRQVADAEIAARRLCGLVL